MAGLGALYQAQPQQTGQSSYGTGGSGYATGGSVNYADSTRTMDAVNFLKQCLNPRKVQQRPPPYLHLPAAYKKVDVNLTFTVSEDPVDTNAVPTSTGIILWLPEDGVGSIYHYGIVPQNHVSNEGVLGNGLSSVSSAGSSDTQLFPVAARWGFDLGPLSNLQPYQLNYTRALCVPRIETGYSLKISPDLAEQFSFSRCYGGLLEMYSSTVAAAGNVLNGLATTAVISDSRDIAQNDAGDDCFSVVKLQQQARTTKEIVSEEAIYNGVVSIQGPDIPDKYKPPNSSDVDEILGGWQVYDGFSPKVPANVATAVGSNIPVGQALFGAFASPWGVTLQEPGQSNGNQTTSPAYANGALKNNIAIDQINETGILDVDFRGHFKFAQLSPSFQPITCMLVFEVCWLFASISNNKAGTVTYQSIKKKQTVTGKARDVYFGAGNGQAFQVIENETGWSVGGEFSCAPQYYGGGGMKEYGKFVGVRVSAMISFDPQQFSGAGIVAGDLFQGEIAIDNLAFRAREIEKPGKVGPCHILRYEQVGEDQTMRITGILNTESVAKGGLAPYIQGDVMAQNYSTDLNVMPHMYALFNSPAPAADFFRCSWRRLDYENAQKTIFNMLDLGHINDISLGDRNVRSSSEAAGTMTGLGSIAHLGTTLGTIHNNFRDAMSGASGQFGSSGSSGQFGANRRARY